MFDNDKIYLTDDPALKVLGSYSTLSHWRSEGRGPSYLKLGSRVAYCGRELNRWLATRTIQPKDQAA
ncbi:MAG: DNA-binding protein [Boseongicola sp.]|nr:DNA-binding protein [Boseongicola sp.]